MRWLFWRKENESSRELKEIKQQVTSMTDQITALDQQLQKLTRLQYKNGKNVEEKIDGLTLNVKDQQNTISSYDSQIINKLIQQIDEMDTIYWNLSSEPRWAELLENWTISLLDSLAILGVKPCIQPEEMFDPARAEAVQTISFQEGKRRSLQPYQIAEFFKRGFVGADQRVLRKAQVVTVREEESNGTITD